MLSGRLVALHDHNRVFVGTMPHQKISRQLLHLRRGMPLVNKNRCIKKTGTTLIRAQGHHLSTAETPYAGRDLAEPAPGFDSIADAIDAIARGESVVVLDDEDRENEGDLILAADLVTPEAMAFVVEHTSGVVCVGMEGADLDRLRIPLMIPPYDNEEAMSTAFTVTVDLREGTTTGISASDRAVTLRALASADSKPEDFKRPGHIFPLRYRPGGVLRRPGHTEAAVDLSRLAGRAPAGVLCEIVNKDGTMARTPELLEFAKRYNLKCITIADLVRYRLKTETLVQHISSGELPTRHGQFTAHVYRSLLDEREHVALVMGDAFTAGGVLAKVHQSNTLEDIFDGSQLDAALNQIAAEGRGVFVYVRGQQEGSSLADELKVRNSASVDVREFGIATNIFKELGAASVRLMTDNIEEVGCLNAYGLETEQVTTAAGGHNNAGHTAKRNGTGDHLHFV